MKKGIQLFAMAIVSAFAVSCTADKDYFDPQAYEKNLKEQYNAAFTSRFGAVKADQSWDFASNEEVLATREVEGIEFTPVAGLDFAVENKVVTVKKDRQYVKVIESTIKKNIELKNNISELLPDKKEQKGDKAVLTAPGNSFTVYPVSAQGAYTYDLFVKVGDEPEQKVFSKDWTDYSKPYFNGMGTEISNSKVSKTAYMPAISINAPVGTPIQIYIKNIKNDGKEVTKNPVGTNTGNSIYVSATARPEGLSTDIMPEDAVIKYVGIEDNIFNPDGTGGGDKDFNDLVIAIVGNPYTPVPLDIKDGEYVVPTKVEKRYMVEDLGSADDFDFNDIVMDVIDNISTIHKTTFVNGVLTEDVIKEVKHEQKAIIRHLGGTLPFTLKIGDTTLESITPQLDSNPDKEFAVSGWSAVNNNIVVTVQGKENGQVTTITFPTTGSIPMIMAFRTQKQWKPEREAITPEWWGGY